MATKKRITKRSVKKAQKGKVARSTGKNRAKAVHSKKIKQKVRK